MISYLRLVLSQEINELTRKEVTGTIYIVHEIVIVLLRIIRYWCEIRYVHAQGLSFIICVSFLILRTMKLFASTAKLNVIVYIDKLSYTKCTLLSLKIKATVNFVQSEQ